MSNSRLRILHVVFSLEPGGMENGLVNVARGLDASRFDVHVCCLNKGGAFVERLPAPENVHILGRQSGFDVKAVVGLMNVISRVKPHVVHTHNLGPLTYSVLATAFGRLRPILHGEHGTLPDDQCTPKRVRQRRWFYRCCRKVHTVSAGQKKQLSDLGLPAESVIPVINGVDTERFTIGDKSAARNRIDLAESESQVIGIVGRFVALKRHLDLLDAFDVIAASNARVRLLVVGSGGAESDRIHARVASSPFRDRIRMAGFQSDPVPFYQSMDLLVVPSIIEGMSNVVLEAMACGVPVLAHNACGNAEMLVNGEDGIVADLSDVPRLTSEIQKLLQHESKLPLMGERARQNVITKFSIKRMVNDYEALYCEVAGVRR